MNKIVLKTLTQETIACPSQWIGETEDGQFFYARYRGGRFRAILSKIYGNVLNPDNYVIINAEIGHPMDGSMSTEQMKERLQGKVEFPIE